VTEAELIAGCRRHDREAQRELYTRTSERIYRLLLRLTQDPQTAADLLQETSTASKAPPV
jgi:RNA polymerase sigma-70 factor (ECF subfamily)